MDFHKLTTCFRQFGGMRLVWQYAKLGVLPVVVRSFFRCLIKGQSFKSIYPEILKKVEPFLIQKYGPVLLSKQDEGRSKISKHEHPKVIWWCWLQGLDNAPEIVKTCHKSLKYNLNYYEIREIDADNWKEYIELPEYIVKKWEKKQIPPALFSDLLRLQLLIKYGGTWIDSTVLCTGNANDNFLNADLFLFQYTPEGTTENISISNWFISAHSKNEVLMTLRDMLFAYWKNYNCTLDYYIFHLFFAMVAKEYPEKIAAMPHGQSQNSLLLLHHWDEIFDQMKWDNLISKVSLHKLAFRENENVKSNKDNYYNYILNSYKV